MDVNEKTIISGRVCSVMLIERQVYLKQGDCRPFNRRRRYHRPLKISLRHQNFMAFCIFPYFPLNPVCNWRLFVLENIFKLNLLGFIKHRITLKLPPLTPTFHPGKCSLFSLHTTLLGMFNKLFLFVFEIHITQEAIKFKARYPEM